jgi:hypothetical protein
MNIDKFVKNLHKINNFDSWDKPKGKLTKIEKDILLEYIRKMYKAVFDDSVVVETKEIINLPPVIETQKIVKEQESKVIDIDEQNEIQTTVNVQEKVAEIKQEIKIEEIPVKVEEIVLESKPVENKVEESKSKALHTGFSDEFMSIFKDFTSKELSEKLSMLPVKDLKKAFGLNEKIFTINELFNGDSANFDKVLDEMNQLNSVAEAKEYIIINIANRFKWDNDHKIKKAEQFFRTIRRRYIS